MYDGSEYNISMIMHYVPVINSLLVNTIKNQRLID